MNTKMREQNTNQTVCLYMRESKWKFVEWQAVFAYLGTRLMFLEFNKARSLHPGRSD